MFNNNERDNMTMITGDSQNDLRTYKFKNGLTLQQTMLLQALRAQAISGLLMTNPRVTGFSSFTKAVRSSFNLDADKKAPKTCKNLYKYLVAKGYYSSVLWKAKNNSDTKLA